MTQTSLFRAFGAAVFALTVAGCTAPQSSLDAPKRACVENLRLLDDKSCDGYVAAALQSKDNMEIARAYSFRALLREFRGDLPGALADTDQALATVPGDTFNSWRRAVLLGESGEYARALELFAKAPALGSPNRFEQNIAMNEYVAGDRAKAVQLFQTAAIDSAENDHDPDMAAILRFKAAIIESELKGGDLAPIAAQDVSARTNTMLPLLKQHRLGEMTDSELIAMVERMTGPALSDNICDGYFSVGHRNAVAGNVAAARQAFQISVERCQVVSFEHHAAKAWLRHLGV